MSLMEIVKGVGSPEHGFHRKTLAPWQTQVVEQSMVLGEEIRKNFGALVKGCNSMLPIDCPENRMAQIMIHSEVLVGACVAAIVQWTNDSGGMEDRVLQAVRDKFEYIRGLSTQILVPPT